MFHGWQRVGNVGLEKYNLCFLQVSTPETNCEYFTFTEIYFQFYNYVLHINLRKITLILANVDYNVEI